MFRDDVLGNGPAAHQVILNDSLEDGRIARYREYFDEGAALLQLGFRPESIAKVLARRL